MYKYHCYFCGRSEGDVWLRPFGPLDNDEYICEECSAKVRDHHEDYYDYNDPIHSWWKK